MTLRRLDTLLDEAARRKLSLRETLALFRAGYSILFVPATSLLTNALRPDRLVMHVEIAKTKLSCESLSSAQRLNLMSSSVWEMRVGWGVVRNLSVAGLALRERRV